MAADPPIVTVVIALSARPKLPKLPIPWLLNLTRGVGCVPVMALVGAVKKQFFDIKPYKKGGESEAVGRVFV